MLLIPPPPCHKLSHLLGPPQPSSVTYFMDGPFLLVVDPNLFSLFDQKFRTT